jgi:hypothetical protein
MKINKGYQVILDPGINTNNGVLEEDLIQCNHCDLAIHVLPFNKGAYSYKRNRQGTLTKVNEELYYCSCCDSKVCNSCAHKPCDVLEKKLARWESRASIFRCY